MDINLSVLQKAISIILIILLIVKSYWIFYFISEASANNIKIKKQFTDLVNECNRISETEKQYIRNRVIDQICYYDNSAAKNKHRYKISQTIIYFLSAVITIAPVLNEMKVDIFKEEFKWVPLICGAGIMFITSFINMNKFSHLMTEHRIVCESLKSLTMIYIYSAENRVLCENKAKVSFSDYVKNIEDVINQETKKWVIITNSKDENNKTEISKGKATLDIH